MPWARNQETLRLLQPVLDQTARTIIMMCGCEAFKKAAERDQAVELWLATPRSLPNPDGHMPIQWTVRFPWEKPSNPACRLGERCE